MMKQVYLILAALMLLCLAPMPYGYYMLVRFVAMVVFGVMVYRDGVSCCLIGTKVRPATHEDTPWPQGQPRDIL